MSASQKLIDYYLKRQEEYRLARIEDAKKRLEAGLNLIEKWTGERPEGEVTEDGQALITIGDLVLSVRPIGHQVAFYPVEWIGDDTRYSWYPIETAEELGRVLYELTTQTYDC